MAAVGIATAAAGIIVGTVTLTGIGLVMAEIVEFLSAGNFMIMLVLVALICIVLGTGRSLVSSRSATAWAQSVHSCPASTSRISSRDST